MTKQVDDGGRLNVELRHRKHQVTLIEALRADVQRSLGFRLNRYAGRIRPMGFRLTEPNATKNETAKHCVLVAHLGPCDEIIVMQAETDMFAVISDAARQLGSFMIRIFDHSRSLKSQQIQGPVVVRFGQRT